MVRLYSAVLLMPVGNDDGDETVTTSVDGVDRADVIEWAARAMTWYPGGRVFVTEWSADSRGVRFDTGVIGELYSGDVSVRWFGGV